MSKASEASNVVKAWVNAQRPHVRIVLVRSLRLHTNEDFADVAAFLEDVPQKRWLTCFLCFPTGADLQVLGE
jgi:hypothetical protein